LLAVLTAAAQSAPPKLNYQVDPNWPQLPAGWNLQETPGIAVDANRHVYVFHRGENPLIEFDPSGKVVRSCGEGMFIRPHAVRIDPEGNIWTVDNDTHQVLKMNPQGRVVMVLGRKGQSGETEINFNRPTDVAFGANGDIYVSDGYGNSRVVNSPRTASSSKPGVRKGPERVSSISLTPSLSTSKAASTSATARTTACRSSTPTASSCSSGNTLARRGAW
jgi:sugar lactone lactonase YvrE